MGNNPPKEQVLEKAPIERPGDEEESAGAAKQKGLNMMDAT